MSDNHTNNATPTPAPPAELLAKAAEILGDDTVTARPTGGSNMLMVTVAGPDNREVMRVPADVAVGRLAATLGEAVGVKVVARISVRNGEVISPSQTLADVGVRAGSVIVVDAPDAPGLIPAGSGESGSGAAGNQQYWSRRSPARHPRSSPSGRTPSQWAVLGTAVAGIVVISMLLGSALFGGSSSQARTKTDPLAVQAARSWVNGSPFTGGRLSGVPADLGRTGPPVHGTIEAVSSSIAKGITSQLFIVGPAKGPSFGLAVVIYKGKVAYPLTVTPLPFATSIPPGGTAVVSQNGKIVPPNATQQAQAWAAATFTTTGPLGPLGFGLNGSVTVLNQWVPKSGAALVTRVTVPLSDTAPGTAAAQTMTTADQAATAAQKTVAGDQNASGSITTKVAADQTAVSNANTAAQQAVAAANAANPPNPPPLAVAAAQVQQAATDAQNALTSDQHTQADAQTKLAADQQAAATAAVAAKKADTTAGTTIESVYDVAYNSTGQPVAWAPADYLIGAN